jgi:hypothetical protein
MTTVNRNQVAYDIGVLNFAGFTLASAVTIPGGFVEMSTTAYTVKNSVGSGTTKPIGVTTASGAAADVAQEVRTGGYVWQISNVTMAAGDPVYPSSVKGKVIKTGKKISGVATAIFPAGFGTVIVGNTASGFILTKLHGLV